MTDAPIETWLHALAAPGHSDLYITVGAAPVLRGEAGFRLLGDRPLSAADVGAVLDYFLTPVQRAAFAEARDFNMAWSLPETGRFRVNFFHQRQLPGLVIRRITTAIPTLAELGLPPLLGQLAEQPRGLIVIAGDTGSGKSTTLAAMTGHRNAAAPGHIVTVEDPIEFIHEHRQCIVTQREVGVDTDSWDSALRNALRQKPDAILIGEVRDTLAMEHALNIAETGHLVLTTLHATNANQAIERILAFFPHERHRQVLLNLSMNLRAVIAQRLVRAERGGRVAALEVMLNKGLVRERIRRGEVADLKPVMADNVHEGMQTFDQALCRLCVANVISEETAVAAADTPNDVRLAVRQARLGDGDGLGGISTSGLSL